jgi:hypothetical protein
MSRLPSSKTAKIWLERIDQCERSDAPDRAVLPVDPLLSDVLHPVKPQIRGMASNKCLPPCPNLRAHRHARKLRCSLANWYTRIYH